jgi:hypothetical protein
MSTHHDDLTSLPAADLAGVTGGAGFDMMSMLPILMMRRRPPPAAASQPMPTPTWKPKVTVDGVEQSLTDKGNGTFATSSDAE